MESTKSLYELELIAALLRDVQNAHGLVFNTRALNLTLFKIEKRVRAEGMGFLTKTLPRLGKAFDKALAGNTPLNAVDIGFKPMDNSNLPRFLGELISCVLQPDGVLPLHPCEETASKGSLTRVDIGGIVAAVRQVCYLFYKYKLPYSDEQEQQVIQKFAKTEDDLETLKDGFKELEAGLKSSTSTRRVRYKADPTKIEVLREARILLSNVFSNFDPLDVTPRHGPGAVATKQQLWDKYLWTNISSRITDHYPLDAYYMASIGHVCDRYDAIQHITSESLPAKVILVPKDSRGPRLISCEPVDYQWIQQGLGSAIVRLVERHWITRYNVFFTDQEPNRRGAYLGSLNGRYVTLDLNEASDRVSTDLVRLLFPEHVYTYLEACRTSSTVLPDGTELKLNKFAPMGSCLCFPILALTIWAILTAAAPDKDTRDSILVYGDDVIVTKDFSLNAIEHLESFGLKVNRDKSCISGLFRESCGMDSFSGVDVTPVRFRTVWSSTRSPDSYSSWIAYANSMYDKKYYRIYDLIVERLLRLYGPIPDESLSLTAISLREVPLDAKPLRRRWNKFLQKNEFYCYGLRSPVINKDIDGWSMLLRFFTEGSSSRSVQSPTGLHQGTDFAQMEQTPFSVGQYTKRRTSMLERRWR